MAEPLSPAAQAIWDAFHEDEAGVFVDYGDKLAAAFRAAADQVLPVDRRSRRQCNIRAEFLAIAAELEGSDGR
jgi:hypothetical protein